MQLTGPLFLFLFFPLCLPVVLLTPRKWRSAVLATVSILWFLLVNRHAAWGLLLALLPVAAAFLAPLVRAPRLRRAFGVYLPLAVCLAARVTAEYTAFGAYYPTGLTVLCLHAAALTPAEHRPRRPEGVLSYLFFFPVLTVGPVLSPERWEELLDGAAPSLPRFSAGLSRFTVGFVMRIAVAAVLWRAFSEWLTFGRSPFALLILLPVAYFALHFFFTGTRAMAQGIAAMFGMDLPAAREWGFLDTRPLPLFFGESLCDALYGTRLPRALCDALLLFAAALLIRPRPEVLLAIIPYLLVTQFYPKRWLRTLAGAVFAFAVLLPEPQALLTLFGPVTGTSFFTVYLSATTARYLGLELLLLPFYLLFRYKGEHILARVSRRTELALHVTGTVLLFAAFLFTVFYFMPQFPALSDGLPLYF